MSPQKLSVLLILAVFSQTTAHAAEKISPSRIMHSKFYFPDEISDGKVILEGLCQATDNKSAATLLTDVAVSLAGKAVGSLVDIVANKAKAEAITLESISSMEGFYTPKEIAADGGCFVIHNGRAADSSGATFKAILKLKFSEDRTAFQFEILKWQFQSFFAPESRSWFQDKSRKDVILKIEFFAPGSDSIGTRSVFIERSWMDATQDDIGNAYEPGEKTPWFRAPPLPSKLIDARNSPLNIKTMVIETSRPKQIGIWLTEIASAKKAEIISLTESNVRNLIDNDAAAIHSAKLTEVASAAFAAYKSTWDNVFELSKNFPKLSDSPTSVDRTKFDADTTAWKGKIQESVSLLSTKKRLAETAYSAASLIWPGDMPAIEANR